VSVLRSRENLQPKLAKLSNLQNLRELQLLMYAMRTDMLSDIYGFLRMCRCSQLRKLFVEVTTCYTLVKCSSTSICVVCIFPSMFLTDYIVICALSSQDP
jgi:hypothetical protein